MASYCSFLVQCLLLILTPSINRNVMAFVPISRRGAQLRLVQPYATRPEITSTRMSLFIEAQDAPTHIQAASNLMNTAVTHDASAAKIDSVHTSLSSSLLSSVSAAASQKSQFNFLGIPLGGAPDPYLNGQSIPPRFDTNTADTISSAAKDVATQISPTGTALSATGSAQAAASSATAATGTANTIDIVDAMPGFKSIKGERPAADIDNIDKIVLTKKDLQYMARAADVASRIPVAMICYVLFDFFFLNADNDIYKEEIDEDAPGVLVESMFTMATRLAVILMFVVATTVSSYMFYQPNI